MAASQRKAETAYQKRQREAGLQKVCVWVPADQREALQAYAKRLRDRSSGDCSSVHCTT